jgi:hypothetical protein
MKQDEAPDPLHVGFFSSDAIVPIANGQAHLIKKFWFATIIGETVDGRHDLTQHGRQESVQLTYR